MTTEVMAVNSSTETPIVVELITCKQVYRTNLLVKTKWLCPTTLEALEEQARERAMGEAWDRASNEEP